MDHAALQDKEEAFFLTSSEESEEPHEDDADARSMSGSYGSSMYTPTEGAGSPRAENVDLDMGLAELMNAPRPECESPQHMEDLTEEDMEALFGNDEGQT